MAIKYIRMTFFESAYMNAFSKTMIRLMEEILHQLIGSLSHFLHGFIHSRWCRISSINSMYCGPPIFFSIGCIWIIWIKSIRYPVPKAHPIVCKQMSKPPVENPPKKKKNNWTKSFKREVAMGVLLFLQHIDRMMCVFDGLIFEKNGKNYCINTV